MTTKNTTQQGLNVPLTGALLLGTGVALGAFGAHGLKSMVSSDLLVVFETGVRYQVYHGLGLLALGAYPQQRRAPVWLLTGALVFALSLYLLALTGVRWLGAITPLGGVLMLVGWTLAVLDFRRERGGPGLNA